MATDVSPKLEVLVRQDNPEDQPTEREQWLAARKQFIGGSDSAAMFNEGYGCCRRLVYDKRGTPIDYPRTPAEIETLQRGTDLEEMVAFKFQQESGLKIRRMGTRISKVEPRAGVNVDRQIVGITGERYRDLFPDANVEFWTPTGVLECKTANEFVFKQILKDGVPPHYVMQMQHSLAVTGYKWGVFAVLGYGPMLWRVIWFPMLRDDNLCDAILNRVPDVWTMVEGGELPPALPQPDKRCPKCEWRRTCLGAQLALNVPDEDKDVPTDDSLAELATDYMVARKTSDEAAELVDTIATQIKERIGDRPGVLVPAAGVGFSYKKAAPPMRWDGKGIEGVLGLVEREMPATVEALDEAKKNPWFNVFDKLVLAVKGCKRPGTPSRPFKPFEL
jgi:predicted phage-related endonuclease